LYECEFKEKAEHGTHILMIAVLLAFIAVLYWAAPFAAGEHTSIQNLNDTSYGLKVNSILPIVLLQVTDQAIPSSLSENCGILSGYIAAVVQQNSPWYCPINNQIYYYWKGELPLALVAIMLSITIASIIFMVGASFKIKALRNFGAAEFYEAFASTLIVVFFLFVSAVLFGLVPSLLVGTVNPYVTALHLIAATISSADYVLQNLFQVYIVAQFIQSITITIETLGSNLAGVGTLLGFVHIYIAFQYSTPAVVLFNFILDGVYGLYLEYYLIVFFAIAAIPAFLVPGVLFRAILPTRPLGGILIAMGIGFYLIMPTLFAVAFYLTAPQLNTQLVLAAHYLSLYDTGGALSSYGELPLLISTIQNLQSSISSFWLLVLFYPVLIISITYAFITQLAAIIGGVPYSMKKLRGGLI